MSVLARLKPYDPNHGCVLMRYTVRGVQFDAGAGWHRVSDEFAVYLRGVHEVRYDAKTPLAFEVATEEEAARLDEEALRRAERRALQEGAAYGRAAGLGPVAGQLGSAAKPIEATSAGAAADRGAAAPVAPVAPTAEPDVPGDPLPEAAATGGDQRTVPGAVQDGLPATADTATRPQRRGRRPSTRADTDGTEPAA